MDNFLVRFLKLSFRLTSHSHRSNFIKHASNIQAYTFILPNYSCGLSTATIEYSCLSVCVSVRLSVCLCVCLCTLELKK